MIRVNFVNEKFVNVSTYNTHTHTHSLDEQAMEAALPAGIRPPFTLAGLPLSNGGLAVLIAATEDPVADNPPLRTAVPLGYLETMNDTTLEDNILLVDRYNKLCFSLTNWTPSY